MEELLKALRLIRDTCRQHGNCPKCPLHIGSGADNACCSMSERWPREWKLVNKVPEVSLFKQEVEVHEPEW